jgi:hypothetical protein
VGKLNAADENDNSGARADIMNTLAFDVPPPGAGVVTVTEAVPAVARSVAVKGYAIRAGDRETNLVRIASGRNSKVMFQLIADSVKYQVDSRIKLAIHDLSFVRNPTNPALRIRSQQVITNARKRIASFRNYIGPAGDKFEKDWGAPFAPIGKNNLHV